MSTPPTVSAQEWEAAHQEMLRSYYVHDRGDSQLGTTWSYLDLTPYGRQEEWEDSPEGTPQSEPYTWWRYHDKYGAQA